MYEKSYMHRKPVTHVGVASATDFILTASQDGHIKFWKKNPKGIEWVKHISAHLGFKQKAFWLISLGPIIDLAVTSDGLYAASISTDGFLKIYDVIAYGKPLPV